MLTPKQEKFVRNLVSGMNKTEAYKKAYNTSKMKEKTINERACVLAKDNKVTARYNELMSEVVEKVELRAEDILNELKAIAFSNGCDYAQIKNNKIIFKDTDKLNSNQVKAVSSIKQNQFGKQIEIYDKLKAIEMLVKYTKIFEEEENKTTKPTLNIVIKDNSNLEKVLYEEE